VRGQQFHESPNEFKKLCQEFYTEPRSRRAVGGNAVDQIIQATWRLRRARMAESGEIALSVDTGWWQRETHNPLPMILNWPRTGIFRPNDHAIRAFDAEDVTTWLYCLRKVRQIVEKQGELTEAALNDFKGALRDQPDVTVKELEQFPRQTRGQPGKDGAGSTAGPAQGGSHEISGPAIRDLEYCEEQRYQREQAEEQARQSGGGAAIGGVLEKISALRNGAGTAVVPAPWTSLNGCNGVGQGEHVPAPMTMENFREA